MLALWVLVTHVMYMQDYWRTWLKGLRGFFFVGALFSAVSVATFCTFLVLAITGHQSKGFRPGGEGVGGALSRSQDYLAASNVYAHRTGQITYLPCTEVFSLLKWGEWTPAPQPLG